jgi:hypothetical protein
MSHQTNQCQYEEQQSQGFHFGCLLLGEEVEEVFSFQFSVVRCWSLNACELSISQQYTKARAWTSVHGIRVSLSGTPAKSQEEAKEVGLDDRLSENAQVPKPKIQDRSPGMNAGPMRPAAESGS